jgi:DNA polymerase (family 10)
MKDQELAKIFYEISGYLEMEGVAFKPYAYQKAAITLESLKEDVEAIYNRGGIKSLREIPGVGEKIALKIEEYLKTGRLRYYDEFKKKMPIDLDELTHVTGMGPKKAGVLYSKLEVKNLQDLEAAARSHQIAPLFGFGEKTEQNILEALEFLKKSKGRVLLGEVLPMAMEVFGKLIRLKEVEKIDTAGSLRRMKETIGDIDFLVTSNNPSKVMDYFVNLPGVVKIWGKGPTKASVRVKEGIDMDVRVIPPESYGAALLYFTGSKEHNIALRKIAIDKGFKLSEYGLFAGAQTVASETEETIYEKLGLPWIPPEIRENRGEIEAALKGKLPRLVSDADIRGDLHVHSNWNGGANPIEKIADAAIAMGYRYIGIADHTKSLKIERGLDEARIIDRNREIDRINAKLKAAGRDFRILKGCEANIMPDGSVDIEDDVLAGLEFVIAGVHSNFKMTRAETTERIVRAMRNPHVDIISHPTGRILKRRDEYEVDFDAIVRTAKEENKILEINAVPERLDLNDTNIMKCVKTGVRMVISTDAHHLDQLHLLKFGVAQARRGWAEAKDIINTRPASDLLKLLEGA